ncbi:translation initiation factor IF-2 [Equus caballus]|uniref:translation initiation factor IF-2 n=1 Tax=Equus caballus TaxID=9796 RepID=UPI0038B36E11
MEEMSGSPQPSRTVRLSEDESLKPARAERQPRADCPAGCGPARLPRRERRPVPPHAGPCPACPPPPSPGLSESSTRTGTAAGTAAPGAAEPGGGREDHPPRRESWRPSPGGSRVVWLPPPTSRAQRRRRGARGGLGARGDRRQAARGAWARGGACLGLRATGARPAVPRQRRARVSSPRAHTQGHSPSSAARRLRGPSWGGVLTPRDRAERDTVPPEERPARAAGGTTRGVSLGAAGTRGVRELSRDFPSSAPEECGSPGCQLASPAIILKLQAQF